MAKAKELEQVNEEKLKEEEKVESANLTEGQIDKMAKEVGEKLKEEEKVRIKIPVDKLNPKDVVVPVVINGYNYFINRGEAVYVPAVVAEVLENAGYI